MMMRIAQIAGLTVGLFFAVLTLIYVCADAHESCKYLWEEGE